MAGIREPISDGRAQTPSRLRERRIQVFLREDLLTRRRGKAENCSAKCAWSSFVDEWVAQPSRDFA